MARSNDYVAERPVREEVPLKCVLPKSRKGYGKEVVSSPGLKPWAE